MPNLNQRAKLAGKSRILDQIKIEISTLDADWSDWDKFLSSTSRGIYLQLSDWLKSYRAYGFKEYLILARNSNGEIIGGQGIVLASAGPLKILVAPYGPIIKHGLEEILSEIIQKFKDFAIESGAFLSQISIPISGDQSFPTHFLSTETTIQNGDGNGLIFKYVTGISAIRAVELYPEKENPYEDVRANYKSATRRDVNKSGRMGNELVFAETEKEIKDAYSLIELNAQNQGYAVRSWDDFGPTLNALIKKGFCFIACCKNEGELKGALIIFEVGKKLHYIMGATIREKRDLMVGHFLQDQVIQLAIKKGYDFYDISMGGSDGVVRFKEGFGGKVIPFVEPQYWVHKKLQFIAYQKLLPWVQKNKTLVSGILKKFR